jgi:hypothetical protein
MTTTIISAEAVADVEVVAASLSAPLPGGLIFIALIGGSFIGLVLGSLAQRGLDRVLRFVAVRKAVRETINTLQPHGTAPAAAGQAVKLDLPVAGSDLAPWYLDRDTPAPVGVIPARSRRARGVPGRGVRTTAPVGARPGMPYYRSSRRWGGAACSR